MSDIVILTPSQLAELVRSAVAEALGAHRPTGRLTLAEAAGLARCSVRRLRDAVRAGELPAIRSGRGGRLLVARADLDTWLAARPAAEPRPAARPGPAPASPLDRAVAAGRIRLAGR